MNIRHKNLKVLRGGASDLDRNLREALNRLKTEFGACCVKLSTEDAGMSLEQIRLWSELAGGILPVLVKIGGPNARNDVRQFLNVPNIDGLIAPMVESVYGLENFMAAVRDFTTPMRMQRLKKHINIETVTALLQLDAILEAPEAGLLDEITIGCSDLSKSMKKDRMDPKVQAEVRKAVAAIREWGISVSIGGGITPENIDALLADLRPQKFNTRVMTFAVKPDTAYGPAVFESLEFELMMLENDCRLGFISKDEEKFRARELRKRLARLP